MPSFSSSVQPAPRKWDAEITKARRHETWLAFEADIHQSAAGGQTGTVRARVARALDRYGLGTSDIVVDEALDYLTHKELGQPFGALGQDLVTMPVGFVHRGEHLFDESERHVPVVQVAHGIDEDGLGALPT